MSQLNDMLDDGLVTQLNYMLDDDLVIHRSRIIVKDILEYVMMDQLRELFSEKGEITDVKLMHNIRYLPP